MFSCNFYSPKIKVKGHKNNNISSMFEQKYPSFIQKLKMFK